MEFFTLIDYQISMHSIISENTLLVQISYDIQRTTLQQLPIVLRSRTVTCSLINKCILNTSHELSESTVVIFLKFSRKFDHW